MKTADILSYEELIKQQGNKRVFHIHIDCHEKEPDPNFVDWLLGRGYVYRNFMNIPDEVNYEPTIHISAVHEEVHRFRNEVADLMKYLKEHPHCMDGYMESESVNRITITESPFNNTFGIVPFVCTFHEKPLVFRENELHITYRQDLSDPRVGQLLRSMGFHKALMMKQDENGNDLYIKEIWTIQGSNTDIQSVFPTMVWWLNSIGGIVNGSIKEEFVYKSWTSSVDIILPRQIDQILFHK